MRRHRIIPLLLYDNKGLVKSVKFKNHQYVGDYLNAIKIFNEKEVDELIFLDINASKNKKQPDIDLIKEIASECFMPLCYGGGIESIEQMKQIFSAGVEKVAINTSAYRNPELIKEASRLFGNQSIVVSIDIKKDKNENYYVYTEKWNQQYIY
jgi:cyclase